LSASPGHAVERWRRSIFANCVRRQFDRTRACV
jgi:hypothetical protein